jgi:hypothetical protein
MTNARSPFRVALVGLAPFVCQRTFNTPDTSRCDQCGKLGGGHHPNCIYVLGDAGKPPPLVGLAPEPVSRLGHTATIGITVSLFCVAYFAWQFAR